MNRNCAGKLASATRAQKESVCDQLNHARLMCEDVKPHCPKCDPKLYSDYLRKRQVAMELFKHASDLRLSASYEVRDWMEHEAPTLAQSLGENGGANAASKAWHYGEAKAKDKITDVQSHLMKAVSKLGKSAAKIVDAADYVGKVRDALFFAANGKVTAENWARYQDEARAATKAAEDMWRKALADFEANLKQAPQCLAESQKANEDEKKRDRAQEAIEKWDNNQALYRDPIKQETLTYEAALNRAKQYLEAGLISAVPTGFVRVAEGSDATAKQKEAIVGALFELDRAKTALGKLDSLVSRYLRDETAIERRLNSAFPVTQGTTAVNTPPGTAPARKERRKPQ